jgi:hypothetical protein
MVIKSEVTEDKPKRLDFCDSTNKIKF